MTYEDTTENGQKSFDPTPSARQTDESTTDRSQSWTQERGSSKKRHTDSTLLLVEDISDGATRVRERRRAE
jgi:hypothetical protein